MRTIKKQSLVAVVLFLLIPVVCLLGGRLFVRINPEIAAGHPNYVQNYHRLDLLKHLVLWGSEATVLILWLLVWLVVIRSKKRSYLWMFLAILGPFGFAVLAMLNDRAPVDRDRYVRFVRSLSWLARAAYEFCFFVIVWVLAEKAMVLKRTLMIQHEAAKTGLTVAQIIDLRNASSGMWAFSEGNEVMYMVILLYLLRPIAFSLMGRGRLEIATPRAH